MWHLRVPHACLFVLLSGIPSLSLAGGGSREEAHLQGLGGTKYVVISHSTPKPDDYVNYVTLKDLAGNDFDCVLPQAAKNLIDEADHPAADSAAESSELVGARLEGLLGRCAQRKEGFWKFEVCHKTSVRQFHQPSSSRQAQNKPPQVEYSLGTFDHEESPSVGEVSDGAELVVKHYYISGAVCEDSGQPRESVVEYRCAHSEVKVMSVQEPATCRYRILVNTRHLCNPTGKESSEVVSEAEGWNLLSGLRYKCFHFEEGWWSYEFCYNRHFRQYSDRAGDSNRQEYVLGIHTADTDRSKQPSQSPFRYYSQVYGEGTECRNVQTREWMGQREIEVRYMCTGSSVDMIASIHEVSPCKYVAVFHSTGLCNHPKVKKNAQHEVFRTLECFRKE